MNQKTHEKKCCWGGLLPTMGTVIAGAAIVAGIAIVFPNALGQLGGIFEKLASTISGLFSGTGGGMTDATWNTIKTLGGTAMIGGGIAYLMGGKKEESHSQHDHGYDESMYATQLKMVRMDNLMRMRAAAVGNPQAMPAHLQGR